jgi:Zn-dependent M28 family amino/carboxypeptidase
MIRSFLALLLALPLSAAVSPTAIKAHIDFLASDALEGRETGTRGYDIAAAYVATQFQALGLDVSTQPVDFRTARIDGAKSAMTVGNATLAHRKDVILRPDFARPVSDASGEIVFAGFGVVAPELGVDDYAKLDVRGRIVLVLSGAPAKFPNDQRAYHSSGERKRDLAAEHGAIGFLTVSTATDEKRFPFAKAASQSDSTAMRVVDGGRILGVSSQLLADGTISQQTARTLFANAPATFDNVLADAEKSVSHSFPLGVSASIHTETTHGTAKAANVIGILSGAEPSFVAYTAHLDHLGIAPNKPGDNIYNGALDNASGVAALIEIARAFTQLPPKPKRSIVFVAVCGEEKGELGSSYFAAHEASNVVADINMDMFTMLFPVRDVIAMGGEHSTLGDLARAAATRAGFEVSPDPQPEEVRFIRSDQYSFVKQGIPAMIFKAGNKSTDPSIDSDKIARDWLRNVYHSVNDNPDQKLDYPSGARWADANFYLGLAVANADQPPAWKPGDFFGEKFGSRQHQSGGADALVRP